MPGIDFPDSSETPFTDPNSAIWDWNGVGWVKRNTTYITEATADGTPYVRKDGAWVAGVEADPEATDVLYVRRNGGWYQVTDVGSGITDAPSDGTAYLRKDAAWANPVVADIPALQAALDAKSDTGHTHVMADVTDAGTLATVNDAPDASLYARSAGVWTAITPASSITMHSALTIMNPEDTDDGTLFFTPVAITVADIRALIQGTTNVVFNLYYGATRNGAGTKLFTVDKTVTTEAGVQLVPDTANIPVNSYVWCEVVSVSGTPTQFHVSMAYTQD